MNICVIGLNYDEGFARYIADEFRTMGHVVTQFDPETLSSRQSVRSAGIIKKVWRRIQASAKALEIYRSIFERRLIAAIDACGTTDLIVVCSDFLSPKTVSLLKRQTHAPIVLWYSDPISSFLRHSFINGPYDALFFKDPYIVHAFKRMLPLPIYYLPECYCPRTLSIIPLSDDDVQKYGCDISTAGNIYAYRIAVLRELKDYDVKVWGNPPPNWAHSDHVKLMFQNEYVAGKEKAKAFRGARIALNSMYPSEIWGVNVRAFEIAGAGGFQLIDWRPGLAQLFAEGREIVSFRDISDLKKKIGHYLAADDERMEIATAGHRRAVAEHTYRHRLGLMLDTVFKTNVSGFPMPNISWTIRNE